VALLLVVSSAPPLLLALAPRRSERGIIYLQPSAPGMRSLREWWYLSEDAQDRAAWVAGDAGFIRDMGMRVACVWYGWPSDESRARETLPVLAYVCGRFSRMGFEVIVMVKMPEGGDSLRGSWLFNSTLAGEVIRRLVAVARALKGVGGVTAIGTYESWIPEDQLRSREFLDAYGKWASGRRNATVTEYLGELSLNFTSAARRALNSEGFGYLAHCDWPGAKSPYRVMGDPRYVNADCALIECYPTALPWDMVRAYSYVRSWSERLGGRVYVTSGSDAFPSLYPWWAVAKMSDLAGCRAFLYWCWRDWDFEHFSVISPSEPDSYSLNARGLEVMTEARYGISTGTLFFVTLLLVGIALLIL